MVGSQLVQMMHRGIDLVKKEGAPVLVEANGLKIFRLLPEEVERLLLAQYGDKLADVNVAKMEKQNQKRSQYADRFRKKGNKTT